MLRICSSVLLLADDEQIVKRIFSVSSAEDVDVHSSKLFECVSDVDSFDTILAEVTFLRFLKDRREKVVVINPGEFLKKLIASGYTRFLFDSSNRLEVLAALHVEKKDSIPVLKFGDLVCDFDNHVFKYKGNEIFVSTGEERFLHRKLVEERASVLQGVDRTHLFRMRKRFGRDFLVNIRKDKVVYGK